MAEGGPEGARGLSGLLTSFLLPPGVLPQIQKTISVWVCWLSPRQSRPLHLTWGGHVYTQQTPRAGRPSAYQQGPTGLIPSSVSALRQVKGWVSFWLFLCHLRPCHEKLWVTQLTDTSHLASSMSTRKALEDQVVLTVLTALAFFQNLSEFVAGQLAMLSCPCGTLSPLPM